MWCAAWPATIQASARTVNGFPLAMPFRDQAASGRLRKKLVVAVRIASNSSTCRAQETSSAPAAAAATSCSKLGSGESKPRANQNAR